MQVVGYQSAFITSPLFGCHGNVPLQTEKQGPGWSSVPKVLSYGLKIAKIDQLYTETKYASFLLWHTSSSQMSSVNSEVTGPNFYTTEPSFTMLMHTLR